MEVPVKVLRSVFVGLCALQSFISRSESPVRYFLDNETPVTCLPDWLYAHEAGLELAKICYSEDDSYIESERENIKQIRERMSRKIETMPGSELFN